MNLEFPFLQMGCAPFGFFPQPHRKEANMYDNDYQNTEMEDVPEENFGEDRPSEESPGLSEETPPAKAAIKVKKDEETFLDYTVEELPVDIGRKSDNHIALEEKNVSRRHARIIMKEDQYVLEDLGSTGGTTVNGETVTEKEIHTGDVIGIGSYQLVFDSGNPEDERTVFESEEATVLEEGTALDEDRTQFYEEPSAKLVVIQAENLEGEIELEEDETILGRDEDNDVTVEDKRISRQHCKIILKEDQYVVSDLSSSNGTFVNGIKVTEKALQNGDRIQIGSSVFEFQMEKHVVVKPKSRLGVFTRVLVALGCLALFSYLATKVIPMLSSNEAHDVVMEVLWDYQTQAAVTTSPALGDLNGDGFINIAVCDLGGTVYGLDARQGGLAWNTHLVSGGGALKASPLLVDINERDGELDVIIGTTTKGVLAVDGGKSNIIWPARVGAPIPSSPAGADMNGDGTQDVIVGNAKGLVVCLDGRQGGAIWQFDTGAPLETAPVLADLNSDGTMDVIIGATNFRLFTLDGTTGEKIWVHAGTEELSTAACADFNGDKIMDIVFVTPSELLVLEGQMGTLLWKWKIPTAARPTSTDLFHVQPPAISYLNKDKVPDVVLSTPGGHVYAVDGAAKGASYLWDFGLTPTRKTGPALCDFNGDKITDVAVGDSDGNLILIDGTNGRKLNSLNVGGAIVSSPVAGDFTSTGVVSIAVATQNRKIVAIQTNTKIKKKTIPWNSFGGDAYNTGLLR
jgi:pSer/pThr/pTyr-binding forkhead associated (FHA) protein